MSTYTIKMSPQKASALGKLLRTSSGECRPADRSGRYAFQNNQGLSIQRGQYVNITGFRSSTYNNCKRFLDTQQPVLIGTRSTSPTDYRATTFIRASKGGHITGEQLYVAKCNCTNEVAAGGSWLYADSSLNLVETSAEGVWRVVAKSLIDSTSTYKVCALLPIKATGGGGTAETITYCSGVSVVSGNLVLDFTSKEVLVPS